MNNFQKYFEYVTPVVKAINEHHNQFYRLEYFQLGVNDFIIQHGLVEFMTENKHLPEHFHGDIPCLYAQWGEESGASLIIELTAEQRKKLFPTLGKVLLGEYYRQWESGVVYLLLDHELFITHAGFKVVEQIDPTNGGVWDALAFISRRLGLNYLVIHDGWHDLEHILEWTYPSFLNA